jgi:biotin carboxyl carrier protein
VQLFVISAMKMEVKVKAPAGMSVVQEVCVKAGRKMVEGALLAKLA